MNLSLSVDNIFHHHNQVFHFHLILLNHHLDSLVHTTIKSPLLFISTISIHFLLHLNHQSSIQHHLIRYLVTMSVLSSIIQNLHLFYLLFSSTGLFIFISSISISNHCRQSQIHWLCTITIIGITIKC
jgi:hypothetical protein